MIRAMAFTGGANVPSARFRVRQFIPRLRDDGILLDEFHGRHGSYPPAAGWKRPLWAASRIAELLPACIRSRRADVLLLQREMVSTLPTLEGLTGAPRLLDVDDSIHLLGGARAARRLSALSDRILCGNSYLAEVYSKWHRDIAILPTAVDTSAYFPGPLRNRDALVVGWIGTSANHDYLLQIEESLSIALAGADAVLRVVSDSRPNFGVLAQGKVQFVQWSASSEVAEIQAFDVGLMPLRDSEWARGKCSYKMLQYMACGVPVVASPVGMNREVFAEGRIGLPAASNADWVDAIRTLMSDGAVRESMGARGRKVVEEHYSVDAVMPRLAGHIREIAGGRP